MALPSGYKRLLYIRSSGTQYINTEFNPKYNTRVVMKISDVDTSIDNQWFFGARDGTTASINDRFTLYKIGETVRSDYFGTSVTIDVSDFTGSTTLDKNGNVASVYGETITNTAVSSGACAYPLFLFVLNNAGTPHSNYASYSLESCQIYDGSTLVRNFIPCTNASGEVGLWDDVNSKFYANAGTGAFTAGPAVGVLPAGYTQLEYIESNGTQYIDLEFYPDQGTVIEMVVSGWSKENTGTTIFGVFPGTGGRYEVLMSASGSHRSYYNGTSADFNASSDTENKTTIRRDGNTTSIGNVSVTHSAATFSCNASIYLFAQNNSGTASRKATARVHSVRLWNSDGDMVRDMVACKSASGVAGLYDTISGNVFGDSAGGEFTAGPACNLPAGDQNANIGNLAREIEGGTVNIGGVAYELECGFVLVGGVSREIPFGSPTANVTITGSGLTRAWVTIGANKYTGAATVEVPKGTALVASCTSGSAIDTYITLNGKTVKTGSVEIAYSMTVEEDTAVKLIGSEKLAGTYYRGRVEITTG